MKILRFIILVIFRTFFYTCVEPFDVNINGTKGYVLVDGTITDLDEPQIISLSWFPPNTNFKSSEFSSIIVNTKNTVHIVPLTKADGKHPTRVAMLDPLPRLEEQSVEIAPGLRVRVSAVVWDVIKVNGDPVDVGAKPRRIVHTELVESSTL